MLIDLWLLGLTAGIAVLAAASGFMVVRHRRRLLDLGGALATLRAQRAEDRKGLERAQATAVASLRAELSEEVEVMASERLALREELSEEVKARTVALGAIRAEQAEAAVRAVAYHAELSKLDNLIAFHSSELASLTSIARELQEAANSSAVRESDLATYGADLRRLNERLNKFLSKNSAANSANYQYHNRLLSQTIANELIERICVPLGLVHTHQSLAYLAHKICVMEDNCIGRLGTTIEAAMTRVLATQSLFDGPGRKVELVEIGSLFAIAAGAIELSCRHLDGTLHMTLIDPLFGYYGGGEPDPVTGMAVTRKNLEENLRRMGCVERTRIIQDLSEATSTLAAIAIQSVDIAIIDGDHSYEGVERDFLNYAPLLKPRGLMVFDDYEVKEWPDVKRFVDEVVRNDPSFEFVASGFRSAIVRKIG